MTIDTTQMCSHLQKKLLEPDGGYYLVWQALQIDSTLTAVVRTRQLHIYRNGKKVLVLAGKARAKIIREDEIHSVPVSDWYVLMKGNTTAADAILYRWVHTSVRFDLSGASLRQKKVSNQTENREND